MKRTVTAPICRVLSTEDNKIFYFLGIYFISYFYSTLLGLTFVIRNFWSLKSYPIFFDFRSISFSFIDHIEGLFVYIF
jgi:hypothetical protein